MENPKDKNREISIQALNRMPYYLNLLNNKKRSGEKVITAKAIAGELELSEIQVRKDLSAISSLKGKPNTGFVIKDLTDNMTDYLCYNDPVDAVIVGVGSLGRALLSYREFENYGLNIVAAFDIDEHLKNTEIAGKMIYHSSEIVNFCRKNCIKIGIITVPAASTHNACEQLIDGGIKAIWNFSPVHLRVPDDVLVQNENVAASLAVLSRRLKERQIPDTWMQ